MNLQLFKGSWKVSGIPSSVYDLDTEGQEIISKLNALDLRKNTIEQQVDYYITLEEYLSKPN
jgi:hypothetical protein